MSDQSPFPRRLKAARTAKGFSQQGLGLRLGMDDNTASARMNQYERGKHTPDYQTLKRMADELGVPVSYFFCEDELSAEFTHLFGRLTDGQKRTVIAVIKEMAK
jgi:transcriptional regulator with XRE-family HTH domain